MDSSDWKELSVICPKCRREGGREWKHCRMLRTTVCADCCRNCEHMDRKSSLGGIFCRYERQKLTAEELKELNIIEMRIKRTKNIIKINDSLGWPNDEMLSQLADLKTRKAELKGEE